MLYLKAYTQTLGVCVCVLSLFIFLFLSHALVLTRKAIFFNFFISENRFRRESTAGSGALTGATPFGHIQGWPKQTFKEK
jgi:hypothetical protein